ncbi:hypothetical protein BRADI_2g03015v3 [Brachypodium distachyon]|uniref:Uncharacterized protein n=1 Tax=Brachypodium distachyon TaxID=15368 RepID=A0A0Q3FWU9_BRADI|nr:hypothetical protein BRADI_2g03015v3 [Brachypodium distachyon]
MSTAVVFQVDAAAAATMVVDVISEHQIEQQPSSTTASNLKLARSLFAVGSLTLVADASTMLYLPPKGPVFADHGAAYYAMLAVVALKMATAYRLSRSSSSHGYGRRFLAFAKGLLLFAGLLLLFLLAVGGFALTALKVR